MRSRRPSLELPVAATRPASAPGLAPFDPNWRRNRPTPRGGDVERSPRGRNTAPQGAGARAGLFRLRPCSSPPPQRGAGGGRGRPGRSPSEAVIEHRTRPRPRNAPPRRRGATTFESGLDRGSRARARVGPGARAGPGHGGVPDAWSRRRAHLLPPAAAQGWALQERVCPRGLLCHSLAAARLVVRNSAPSRSAARAWDPPGGRPGASRHAVREGLAARRVGVSYRVRTQRRPSF